MNRAEPVSATVQVGTVEIPYRRAGTGGTVILLDTAPGGAGGGRLFEALARRFRVVLPAMPAGEPLLPWLLSLVDGLGLIRPGVLLAGGPEDWPGLDREELERIGEALGPVLHLAEAEAERFTAWDDVPAGEAAPWAQLGD